MHKALAFNGSRCFLIKCSLCCSNSVSVNSFAEIELDKSTISKFMEIRILAFDPHQFEQSIVLQKKYFHSSSFAPQIINSMDSETSFLRSRSPTFQTCERSETHPSRSFAGRQFEAQSATRHL